jgi:energy-coupling factor transport system permease protein
MAEASPVLMPPSIVTKAFAPGALLWSGLMAVAAVFAVRDWRLLLFFTLLAGGGVLVSTRYGLSLGRRLWNYRWLLLLNYLFVFFFGASFRYPGTEGWWQWAWFRAAFFTLRFLLLLLVVFLLGGMVRAEDFFAGLLARVSRSGGGKGLRRFLWTVILAYGFLPILKRRVEQLRLGLLARGINLKGSVRTRLRLYPALLLPLLQDLFVRAEQLGGVLQARGFDPEAPRTPFADYRWRYRDWLLVLGSTAGGLLVVLW